MKRLVYLALLCTAALAPGTVLAQEEGKIPPKTSLSLTPFGGTTIGLWHRFNPGLEAGVEVGASTSDIEGEDDLGPEETRNAFSVEASLKLFGAPRGALQPYGIGSVYMLARTYQFSDAEDDNRELGLSLGGGLEWSPVARVRIGGHAGVRAAMIDGRSTTYQLGDPIEYDVSGWTAATFTSGLIFYYSF